MEHFCGWTLIDDDKLRPKEIFTPAGFPHNSSHFQKKRKKIFLYQLDPIFDSNLPPCMRAFNRVPRRNSGVSAMAETFESQELRPY